MNWDDALKSWTRVTEKQMDSEEYGSPADQIRDIHHVPWGKAVMFVPVTLKKA